MVPPFASALLDKVRLIFEHDRLNFFSDIKIRRKGQKVVRELLRVC